jgi:opacity protein-like surface antigen
LRNLLLTALAAVLAAPAVHAAEQPTFRIVPQAGYRFGGSLEDADTGAGRDLQGAAAFGLALELRYGDDNRWLQLWYSRQPTEVAAPDARFDVDVDYLHVGGTAPIDDTGKVQSYVSAGIGAARFSPSGEGLASDTRFSGSLGLGVMVPFSERIALRVEARAYLTLVDADTSFFCRTDNGEGRCAIVASGSSLFQAELLAGISVGF